MDLTVDSATDSDDVECIIENSTDFKDSFAEDCTSGDNRTTTLYFRGLKIVINNHNQSINNHNFNKSICKLIYITLQR